MIRKWFFKVIIGLSTALLLVEGIAHLSIAIQGVDSWAMHGVSEIRKSMEISPKGEYIRAAIALLTATAGIFALRRGGMLQNAYGVLLCLLLVSSAWTELIPEWHQGLRSTQELLIAAIVFTMGFMIALGLGNAPKKRA